MTGHDYWGGLEYSLLRWWRKVSFLSGLRLFARFFGFAGFRPDRGFSLFGDAAKTLFQSFHDVDDVAALRRSLRHADFLAFRLFFDQIQHPLRVFVFVFIRFEDVVGELVDEPGGELGLGAADFGRFSLANLAEVAHLVGKIHGVKHQPVLRRTDDYQIFFPSENKFGQRDFARLDHRIRQQPIGFFTAFVGAKVITFFEVDRIDFR